MSEDFGIYESSGVTYVAGYRQRGLLRIDASGLTIDSEAQVESSRGLITLSASWTKSRLEFNPNSCVWNEPRELGVNLFSVASHHLATACRHYSWGDLARWHRSYLPREMPTTTWRREFDYGAAMGHRVNLPLSEYAVGVGWTLPVGASCARCLVRSDGLHPVDCQADDPRLKPTFDDVAE